MIAARVTLTASSPPNTAQPTAPCGGSPPDCDPATTTTAAITPTRTVRRGNSRSTSK